MNVITRDEAIDAGLKHYFTGEPCAKAGHLSKRAVRDRYCYECQLARLRAYKASQRAARGAIPRPKTDEERDERRRSALRRYAEKHPERLKDSQQKYRENNRRKWLESKRKWSKANLDLLRDKSARRRAKTNGGRLSRGIAQKLLRLQKGRCVACSADIRSGYQIDHIVPIALGGSHVDSNIQLLCPRCNRKKGAKDPIRFAQENGRLL